MVLHSVYEDKAQRCGRVLSPSPLLVCLPSVCTVLIYQPVNLLSKQKQVQVLSLCRAILKVIINSYQRTLTKSFYCCVPSVLVSWGKIKTCVVLSGRIVVVVLSVW